MPTLPLLAAGVTEGGASHQGCPPIRPWLRMGVRCVVSVERIDQTDCNVLRQTSVTALKKAMHQDTQPQLGLIEPRSTFGRTIALMLRREVAQEGPPLLLVHHTATRQHTARLQWAAKKHLSQ